VLERKCCLLVLNSATSSPSSNTLATHQQHTNNTCLSVAPDRSAGMIEHVKMEKSLSRQGVVLTDLSLKLVTSLLSINLLSLSVPGPPSLSLSRALPHSHGVHRQSGRAQAPIVRGRRPRPPRGSAPTKALSLSLSLSLSRSSLSFSPSVSFSLALGDAWQTLPRCPQTTQHDLALFSICTPKVRTLRYRPHTKETRELKTAFSRTLRD